MKLNQWIDAIGRFSPSEIELGLERVSRVHGRLFRGRAAPLTVSIAGTNGKGTCAHFLERVLRTAGRRTGLYTSPHLLRFNERIIIDGQAVGDDALCAAFERVEAARDDEPLTFFEFTTLAALCCFDAANCDVLILEVGLGGRLDAVNVVDADIAIVTRIGMDHTEYLGDTLEQIGAEKAGIFRRDRPAIVADPEPPASLARCAADVGAVYYERGSAFHCVASEGEFVWRSDSPGFDALPRPPGTPLASFAAGLMALQLMEALPTEATLRQILAQWQLAGRLHWIPGSPSVLLDVAHNAQAATVLARRLQTLPAVRSAVVGMLADKDVEAFASALSPLVEAWHTVTVGGPRGQGAAELASRLRACDCAVTGESASVAGALAIERARAAPGDVLLVCGSFHIVGPALAWLGLYSPPQRAAT